MKPKLAQLLVCPGCKSGLDLFVFAEHGSDNIHDGYLHCRTCAKGFLIAGGIPRMLPERLYHNDAFRVKYRREIERVHLGRSASAAGSDKLLSHKANTLASFGWEWENYNRFGWERQSKDEFWSVENERERFFNNTLFEPGELSNKLMLDAGCGNGRYMIQCLQNGAEVVGVDLSSAIDVARENLGDHPNAHFVQGDLLSLPFRPQSFDLVFSIGVLMHTGAPQQAFGSITSMAKKGGGVGISVYQKQNPLHEFNDKWIRAFTTRFPRHFLKDTCNVMAKLARSAWKIRTLGLINALFRLEPYELCIYDWYSAPVATHHTLREVQSWFQHVGINELSDSTTADRRDAIRKWVWPMCGFTIRGNRAVDMKSSGSTGIHSFNQRGIS